MGCHSSKATQTAVRPPKLNHSKSSLESTEGVNGTPTAEKVNPDTDTIATVSTADNTDEAPCVVLSEYDEENYCTVTRVLRSGPGRMAVEFVAVGDGSLGSRLPDPMNSVVAWPGGSVKPTSKVYEREDFRYIAGTLHYTLDEDYHMFYYLSGELTFSYGTEGYSSATLIVQGAGIEAGAQAWTQLHQSRGGPPLCGQLPRVSEGGGDSPTESQRVDDDIVDRGVLLLPREEPHVPASIPALSDSTRENTHENILSDDNQPRPEGKTEPGTPHSAAYAIGSSQADGAEKTPVVIECPVPSITVRAGPEAETPICCRGCCCPSSSVTPLAPPAST